MKRSDRSVVPSWAVALEFRTGFTGFIIVFHKIEKKTRGSDGERIVNHEYLLSPMIIEQSYRNRNACAVYSGRGAS